MVFALWAFSQGKDSQQPQLDRTSSNITPETMSRMQVLKRSLRKRTTLLGALFIFVYQGAEVSVSGWFVSFLISYRHGDPSQVGYVSAGFWGGITVGRLFLTYPASRLGEKISVSVMTVGSVAFQLLIWLVPNLIGESVMVAILGVLLGAAYPCPVAVFTKLIPAQLHISSLSFTIALGSNGAAVFPLMTGLLSQKVGTTTCVHLIESSCLRMNWDLIFILHCFKYISS